MAKRALVTGCNGFVGAYLCGNLLADGYEVHGIDLQEGPRFSGMDYSRIDLSDPSLDPALIADFCVDEIYHLAAVANPRVARERPTAAYRTSVNGILALLEATRIRPAALLVVGSSEEYAKREGLSLALGESDPVEAESVYGGTKAVQEAICRSYMVQFGLRIMSTRSFNHTGPGQAPIYALSDFALQVALIAEGKAPRRIVTGNIDLERDFLDVRDVVDAYRLIAARGLPGRVYNVASGTAISLRSLIGAMLSSAGLEDVEVVPDLARFRPGEPIRVVGRIERLVTDTGWLPRRDISETVRSMVSYWREEISSGRAL